MPASSQPPTVLGTSLSTCPRRHAGKHPQNALVTRSFTSADDIGSWADDTILRTPGTPDMVQELMCGHRERFGDVEQAEATVRAAESLDSSWPLTLMWLARYASDRGDAERGLSLVRRAGATAEHELVML